MPTNETSLGNLPEDKQALQAMLRALWHEREQQKQRIDELYLENLKLQNELFRYKKATYGPRADRLRENELAQVLLECAEELEKKPLPVESVPHGEASPEVRHVQRRKGRRALANLENLPVSTHVYELTAEHDAARAAASSGKKSAARRAGRSNTSPDTSSACSMCVRSMPAPSVSWREKIRRSRQQQKRRRRSKKALRVQGCWP